MKQEEILFGEEKREQEEILFGGPKALK